MVSKEEKASVELAKPIGSAPGGGDRLTCENDSNMYCAGADGKYHPDDIAAERKRWQKEVAWKDSRFRLWKARAEKAEARIAELEKELGKYV